MNRCLISGGFLLALSGGAWAEPAVAADPIPTVDEANCPAGEAPEAPWQIARVDDLLTDTEQWVFGERRPLPNCSAVALVDLDGDGNVDWAQLEIDPMERSARLRFFRRSPEVTRVWTARTWPALSEGSGSLTTWLFVKPPGESVMREYMDSSQREALSQRGAVEVCEPPGGPEAVLTALADQRCYCSTWLWLEEGEVESTTVCD